MDDEASHPIIQGLAILGAFVGLVFAGWCTVIAFVGGTMPIIGLHTDGGVGFGLLWLLIFDPIVALVCYWIMMIVLLPFIAVAAARESRSERRASAE